MGVADNRTFKNEYHFTLMDPNKSVEEEYPSIKKEDKINTTIKDNPYRSNVEIEGGEIVLQPDLTALFKATGKKHSGGGMDVLLKPNSFVFSDFEGLKLSKKDHELFELKEGGKKASHTPADVLKRNVDIKHYNTMVNIMDDPYKDDLAKRTAALMLEKYLQTVGNVAFIQEEKKGLPDGIPEFSMNTAPVYDPSVKQEIDANKQYAKAGGKVGNPYMQAGGYKNPNTGDILTKEQIKARIDQYIAKYGNDGWEKIDRDFPGAWQYVNGSKPAPGSKASTFDFNNPLHQPAFQDRGPLPGPFTGTRSSTYDWNNPLHTPAPAQERPFDFSTYTGPNPTGNGKSYENGNEVTPPPQNEQTAKAQSVKQGVTPPVWGLHTGDVGDVFQNIYGESNAADKLPPIDRISGIFGYTGPKNNKDFQKWLYDQPGNKAIIDKWHQKYNQGPTGGKPSENKFDGFLGKRWQGAIKELLVTRPTSTPKDFSRGPLPTVSNMPGQLATPQAPGPKVPELNVAPQGSKQADWRFTPWQKLSQLWSAGQYANVKRYMPYRSRYNATYVDPALVNPEQAVGDVKGVANQQLSSLTTLNPILRNAQAAAISGQVMNQAPGIRSQYDNQNAQILNQTRQYNNQVKNNETLVNMGNDQQYYRETIEGRKNFDNMKQYTANNYMNNVFRDVETNQKLAYNLLTQNQPAYGFDWRTGNFTRNNKSILDVPSNQVNESYSALQQLVDAVTDPEKKAALAIKLEGIKKFGSARNEAPQFFKKGGKTKKNPYKW